MNLVTLVGMGAVCFGAAYGANRCSSGNKSAAMPAPSASASTSPAVVTPCNLKELFPIVNLTTLSKVQLGVFKKIEINLPSEAQPPKDARYFLVIQYENDSIMTGPVFQAEYNSQSNILTANVLIDKYMSNYYQVRIYYTIGSLPSHILFLGELPPFLVENKPILVPTASTVTKTPPPPTATASTTATSPATTTTKKQRCAPNDPSEKCNF